ncbi:hypothetical protein [Flavobacterium branchiophilum]|uniref:hypothetical protein n=1 Tax=Flavobacterium branchiophilum TaxID=55197 RepID=UPI001153479F|nr:hypothetical protein [Flavobacterium branchiophilum]
MKKPTYQPPANCCSSNENAESKGDNAKNKLGLINCIVNNGNDINVKTYIIRSNLFKKLLIPIILIIKYGSNIRAVTDKKVIALNDST